MTESLDFGPGYRCSDSWRRLLHVFGATVREVGIKEAACSLDVSPTDLHNALAERSRRYIKAEWTPWLIVNDPRHEALSIYADLCGMTLRPRKRLTAEEKLSAVMQKLRAFSPVMAAEMAKEIGE